MKTKIPTPYNTIVVKKCSFGLEDPINEPARCLNPPVWRFTVTSLCYCDEHKEGIIRFGGSKKFFVPNKLC